MSISRRAAINGGLGSLELSTRTDIQCPFSIPYLAFSAACGVLYRVSKSTLTRLDAGSWPLSSAEVHTLMEHLAAPPLARLLGDGPCSRTSLFHALTEHFGF